MTALVVCLHNGISPSAIAWLVITINIDSIERRHILRTSPHVSEKYAKIIPPCVAHANSSAAIVLVFLVIWIFATSFGVRPSAILNGLFFDAAIWKMCLTVDEARLSLRGERVGFAFQASTAYGPTLSQWVRYSSEHCATITSAHPRNVFAVHDSVSRQNHQSTESAAR